MMYRLTYVDKANINTNVILTISTDDDYTVVEQQALNRLDNRIYVIRDAEGKAVGVSGSQRPQFHHSAGSSHSRHSWDIPIDLSRVSTYSRHISGHSGDHKPHWHRSIHSSPASV